MAGIDTSLSLGGRSYPKSGSIEGTLGYSYVFWGDWKESSDLDPWYGYIRPYIKPGVSVNFDAFEAGIEVFPISFLGVRAFNKTSNNRGNIEAFECDVVECEYDMEAQALELDLLLGYADVFFGARMGRQAFFELENENALTPIVDPRSGLSWVPNEDDEMSYTFCFLGYRISEAWQVIGLYNKYEIERTGDESQAGYLFVNKNWGRLSTGVGLGSFKSELKEEQASVIFNMKWTLLKGPSLF